jgi:hypothetical protein
VPIDGGIDEHRFSLPWPPEAASAHIVGEVGDLIKSHADIDFTAAPKQDGSSAVTVVGRGNRYVRDQVGVILAELSEAQPVRA